MSQKLAIYGQWTYRGAWALEIAAATIGLLTGIVLGYQAFNASESVGAMDLALASAPFFMVALAELTKIPVATLLFGAGWIWKPVILVFLIALAGITFETVFFGLERAGALRQLRYEELANKIDALSFEAAQLVESDRLARESDEVAAAQAEIAKLQGAKDAEKASVLAQIDRVGAELEEKTVLSPQAKVLREQLEEKQKALETARSQRDSELRDAVAQFERQRESYTKRIESARSAGDLDSARRTETELSKLANPRPRIQAQHQARIDALEAETRAVSDEFDAARAASPDMPAAQREALSKDLKGLQESLAAGAASWDASLAAAQERLADAQSSERDEANALADGQTRLREIASEQTRLEAQRIPMARLDQVRRIASKLFGVKPEAVSADRVGLVAMLWFGSLAAVAALAGPITAMVALGLQQIAGRMEEPLRPSRLSRLIRRLLLGWRWRRVRTVERLVEVPVEKKVTKRVEVPVEKVIKEILYVPVFTDDPEALRQSLAGGIPGEVADLVMKTAPGAHHAGKA